jgi:hypothetical protein
VLLVSGLAAWSYLEEAGLGWFKKGHILRWVYYEIMKNWRKLWHS